MFGNYNILSNPMYSGDIGETFLNCSLPVPPLGMYYPGISGPMEHVKMQGHLVKDQVSFSTQQEKDSRTLKTVLALVAGVALGFAGVTFGKKGFSKVYNKIANVFSKNKTKNP